MRNAILLAFFLFYQCASFGSIFSIDGNGRLNWVAIRDDVLTLRTLELAKPE